MKTMKKFVALLVALVMAVSCLTTVFAADSITATAKADAETVKPGDTFEVVVSVSEATFAGYSMKLTYDTSALKLVSVTKNADNNPGLFSANTNAGSKVGTVSLINAEDFTASGVLFTAKFEVLSAAADGNYDVALGKASFAAADQSKLNLTVVNASVEVKTPHTHSYEKVVTDATCTEAGYTTYTCACGVSYKDDEVAALGHKWDDGVVTTEPTESAAGIRTYTCAACGETKTEVIPMLDHTHKHTAEVTAPTCTEAGYTTYTCACGDSYKDDEVAALGHKWDDGVVTTEPTESATGIRTYTCGTCGETKTEVIPMLDHTHKYTSEVVAPTCTEAGYTAYTCFCGDTYKADEVKALGHDYAAEVVAPTCTEAGYTTYTCSVCDDTYKGDEVAALGHKYTAPTFAWSEDNAACAVSYSCGECEESFTKDAVVTVEDDSTCTVAGTITYTAAVEIDGEKYSEVKTAAGAVLPHDYVIVCTWNEDNTVAGAKMTCKGCDEAYEVAGEEVTVSEEKKANGETVYIASFVVNGQTYSVAKVIPAPDTADGMMIGLYATMLLAAAAAFVVLKKKAII